MDKVDKAVALAVDNAARIESTARLLRSHINGGVSVRYGATVVGKTSFGSVKAGACAIVAFEGDVVSVTLDGQVLDSGASPRIVEIASDGELALGGARSGARAIVFGSI